MKKWCPHEYYFLLLALLVALAVHPSSGSSSTGPFSSFSPTNLSNLVQDVSRHGHGILTRSIPALRLTQILRDGSIKTPLTSATTTIREVAVKTKKKRQRGSTAKRSMLGPLEKLSKLNVTNVGGVYYGISADTFAKATRPVAKKPTLSDSMAEALEELRTMRQEIETMRKDMQTLKRKIIAEGDFEEEDDATANPSKAVMARRKRQRECEKMSADIERWAKKILYEEGEEDGWNEITCNKMMAASLNPKGQTKTYIKWMKDSRGEHADMSDTNEYPCIKVFATIDAPVDRVCTYLAQESVVPEYNDLVVKYKDIDEIAPQCKICWSQTPQILFLKPRDFITFCHHRWTRDGTQVIVNQATEHPDFPVSKSSFPRAFALRGANFLSKCPDDPEKTRIALVAHASPGHDVPQWACKTAVNAMAPIEPFKLFHKINENVKRNQPKLQELMSKTEMVSSLPGGRSPRPAGIAQMGYACFWPKGGGLQEGALLDEHEASSPSTSAASGQQDLLDQPGPENNSNESPESSEVSESSS